MLKVQINTELSTKITNYFVTNEEIGDSILINLNSTWKWTVLHFMRKAWHSFASSFQVSWCDSDMLSLCSEDRWWCQGKGAAIKFHYPILPFPNFLKLVFLKESLLSPTRNMKNCNTFISFPVQTIFRIFGMMNVHIYYLHLR